MTRTRHRTIAAHLATSHLQTRVAPSPAEIERGALADFFMACLIAGLWAFVMGWAFL
jgi:hypothetical protein